MQKSAIALALAIAAALPAGPAAADPYHRHSDRWERHGDHRQERVYDSRGRYRQPHYINRNSHVWRGRDGRYYCRLENPTPGLVIGAGVGALAGHELAGNGDRTLGAILGGVLGGVLGRQIDRGDLRCR